MCHLSKLATRHKVVKPIVEPPRLWIVVMLTVEAVRTVYSYIGIAFASRLPAHVRE